MIYRLASSNDLPEIARVHIECFPGTFITSLGHKLIEKYYWQFFQEENLFVVAEQDSQLFGFCMGYLRGSQARRKFIELNKKSLMIRCALSILSFNRVAIKRCILYFFPPRKNVQHKQCNADGDLLSICVTDSCKGGGVSINLVSEFEDLLRKKGAKNYKLSVKGNNHRAIRFYKKCSLELFDDRGDELIMYKNLV